MNSKSEKLIKFLKQKFSINCPFSQNFLSQRDPQVSSIRSFSEREQYSFQNVLPDKCSRNSRRTGTSLFYLKCCLYVNLSILFITERAKYRATFYAEQKTLSFLNNLTVLRFKNEVTIYLRRLFIQYSVYSLVYYPVYILNDISQSSQDSNVYWTVFSDHSIVQFIL